MAFTRTYFESITQNHIVPKIADATFSGSPFAYWLRQNHSIKFRGGRNIQFPILAKEFNSQWWSGTDSADLEILDPEQSALFAWKYLRVPFAIQMTDIWENGGEDGIIDIMEARKANAENTIVEALSDALAGTNASNSKQLDGLQNLFGATGTSYGGLLDTDVTTLGGSWLTTDLSLIGLSFTAHDMRRMRGSVTVGTSKPNLGLSNFPTFNKIWSLAEDHQRFGMQAVADLGFDNVVFEGMPIMPDPHVTGSGYGTADNALYFLNLDYLFFYIHESVNFKHMIYEPLPQQEIWLAKIILGCNLATNNRRMHAMTNDIDPAL